MNNKVLHILCPDGPNGEGWVITVLPPCYVNADDCPVPGVSNVSMERFTPSSLFRCSGDMQVSVVVKAIARG